MVPVEMYGPANIDEWELSYDLFRTACICKYIISPERLDAYSRFIRELARKFPDAWAIIYQADVRTRREHAGRVKFDLMRKHEVATTNGWASDFKVDTPWDSVWHELVVGEKTWWDDQVKEPCRNIGYGVHRIENYVGGDALTSQGAKTHGTAINPYPGTMRTDTVPIHFGAKRQQQHLDNPHANQPPLKVPKLAILDTADVDVSRRGKALCPGFQTGACVRCNTATNLCSVDGTSLHICSICRRPGHGAHLCGSKPGGASAKAKAGAWKRKRARGKGGGKGGKGKDE